jgi:hypothetical protein
VNEEALAHWGRSRQERKKKVVKSGRLFRVSQDGYVSNYDLLSSYTLQFWTTFLRLKLRKSILLVIRCWKTKFENSYY